MSDEEKMYDLLETTQKEMMKIFRNPIKSDESRLLGLLLNLKLSEIAYNIKVYGREDYDEDDE